MSLPRYPQYKDSKVEWLGRVPHGWDVMRLMRVASVNDDVLPESTSPTFEIEYVDIGSVSLDRGIERAEKLIFSDAPSRARRLVRDGDVLVSTVRTYLKAIAPVVNQPENLVVSTGFAVIRPMLKLCPGYAKYALQTTGFVDEVISRSTGVSYPAINASDLVRISIPVPSLDEQAAIVAFLDLETSKIDALISEQEKLIALLAEKRVATISQAVTRGLDRDSPTKESRAGWLGSVPSHWKVVPLRWYSRCNSGDGISSTDIELAADTEHKIPAIGGNGRMGFTFAGNVDQPLLAIGRVGALCGNVHLVQPPAWISDNALMLTPSHAFCLEFLAYVLRSRNLNEIASKTAQPLITGTQVADQRVPLPPMIEQEAIAEFINYETGKFDALQAQAENAVALFKERRSALISAAATGQIDVRSAVSQAAIQEEFVA